MPTADEIFAKYGVARSTPGAPGGRFSQIASANPSVLTSKARARGGPLSAFISEAGGAGASALSLPAAIALAPVTGGASLIAVPALAAFAGGTIGKGVEQKVRDDQDFFGAGGSAKSAFGEGTLAGVLSGLGSGVSALRGAKALTGVGGMKGLKLAAQQGAEVPGLLKAVAGGKGAVNRAIGEVGETGKVAGGFLRQSTIAGKSKLTNYSDQQALIDVTKQFKELRGSAFNKFRNVEPVLNKLNKQVATKLTQSGGSIQSSLLDDELNTARSFITNKGELNRFNSIMQKGYRQVFGGLKAPANPSLLQVNQLKQYVNSQASNVFNKINKGVALTSTDDAILGAREALANILDEHAPKAVREAVSQLNKQQSVLIKGIPEFQRLSEEGIQVLGTKVPGLSKGVNRGIQAVSDYAGRGVSLAGSVPGVRPVLRQAAFQAPGNLTKALSAQPQEETNEGGMSSDTLGQLDPSFAMQGTQVSPLQRALQVAMISDLQQTGGKRVSALKAVYDIVGGGGSALTADQRNKQAKAQSVMQGVGRLLQNFQTAGGGQGNVGLGRSLLGRTPGVRSLGLDKQAQVFEDQRKALIAPLARTISGEVGVLTDYDIKRAEGLLPRLSDPSAVAQQKINDLLFLIQNTASGGGGGLSETIQQLQDQPEYSGVY